MAKPYNPVLGTPILAVARPAGSTMVPLAWLSVSRGPPSVIW